MVVPRRDSGLSVWLLSTFGLGAVTLFALAGPARRVTWTSPIGLFVIITIAASSCIVASLWVLGVGHRHDLAEVGILATGLTVVSMLPLVHGLTAPGVLYGPNQAVRTSAFLALPVALVAWAPLALRHTGTGRFVARHWRAWSAAFVGLSTFTAAFLLMSPQIVVAPSGTGPAVVTMVVAETALALWLSWQQLRLYQIGQQQATLLASVALVFLALTPLVWLAGPSFSVGWWLVHALDIAGVFGGCFGVLRSHRLGRGTVEMLAPVLALDPLAALEIGLAPVVHRFVAALEAKDPITRDHVVRTAALAMRVGASVGLPPRQLRALGLAALLHDIGKLDTPDGVLNKPGRLTPDEYQVIQRHTVDGDALVASVPSLAAIAPLVRGHHERVDGGGYPDGLRGDAIPIEARIIAVCDAFDAMAHTRQYREGMGSARAFAVLQEHAGSQWDRSIVEQIVRLAPEIGHGAELSAVGRAVACDCADALPESVQRQLV